MKYLSILGAGLLLGVATPVVACEAGAYRASARDIVALSVRPTPQGGQEFRYTFLDGRRGSVGSGEVECVAGGVRVKRDGGAAAIWPKLQLSETPARFSSHGEQLSGMLLEPRDGAAERPLVIFVHGSERTSPIGGAYSYLLAAQGLSVFVYDKRGTGASEGQYTQNFELLADDAVAASKEARRLAEGRYKRFGYFGGSQGGWVAPLAAKRSNADFVAVGFGLVMSPLDEDRDQVLTELRAKGHDARVIAAAREVTDATGDVIASHFTAGFDRLAEVKRRFADEAWLGEIKGEFTGEILRSDEAELRRTGAARLDNLGIIWRYDSMPVIGGLDIPQLWILAGADQEAPVEVTRERLTAIRRAGKPVDIFVFPDTDHGMVEFVEQPDGTRNYTRITEGYFRLVGDWIKKTLAPSYGRGQPVR